MEERRHGTRKEHDFRYASREDCSHEEVIDYITRCGKGFDCMLVGRNFALRSKNISPSSVAGNYSPLHEFSEPTPLAGRKFAFFPTR